MKLSIFANVIHANLHGQDIELPRLVIDSRKVNPGEMFIALKGENHDGHDFIENAIERGARVIIAEHMPATLMSKVAFLEVKDTTLALGEYAAFCRQTHPIPLVGITGSCGKTTVKGMIQAICEQQGKTLATKGNFNNHIGLPLTLLELDSSYELAVIEMGANHVGEIAYLGKMAQPTVSLITNVAPAHLEGFGSIENVAKAKGEIYEILTKTGTAILNHDDAFFTKWAATLSNRRMITFGLKEGADIFATDIHFHPFEVEFKLHLPQQIHTVSLPIPGKHTVMNALAASAAGIALGITEEKIIRGLTTFQGVNGRLRRLIGLNGAIVIDDTYNANPGSVQAALEVLASCKGEKIFVMGDMGELGENAAYYHTLMGQTAKQKGVNHLLAVGKLSSHAVSAFGQGATFYNSKQELINDLTNRLNSEMIVLVKGSRSQKMEIVTQALTHKD